MNIQSERADYFQPDTQVVAVENVEILLEKAVEAERERIANKLFDKLDKNPKLKALPSIRSIIRGWVINAVLAPTNPDKQ